MRKKGKLKIACVLVAAAVCIAVVSVVAWRGVLKALHPIRFAETVTQTAQDYDLDPYLLYALIRTESSFREDAESSAGALGLTQITEETFLWLQSKTGEALAFEELRKPQIAVRYGAFFLSLLLKEFTYPETALAAYHAGRGQVNKWLDDPQVSKNGVTLDAIPFSDTAHYVSKVMQAYQVYQKLYT